MSDASPFPAGSIEHLLLTAFLQQLSGTETPAEMATIWTVFGQSTGQPPVVLYAVWVEIRQRCGLSAPASTPVEVPAELPPPRLHVDLGTDVAIGNAMEVEFHLICPGYTKSPIVVAQLSGTLDRTHWKEKPRLVQEEPGYWKFYETCALRDPRDPDKPCAPGSYRVELEISFPSAPPGSLGRDLRASLRFSVPDPEKNASNTLEIDGDGLSVIDLAGLDMTRFGKVVISGGDKSVISLDAAAQQAPVRKTADSRYFQLPLKRHYERDAGRLFASSVVPRPAGPLSKIALRFEGGGRYLVFAKERLQFGRQRSERNDVILRFVPGTDRGLFPEHQDHETRGEAISREHFALALTRGGLTVEDLGSSSGTIAGTVELRPRAPHVLQSRDPRTPLELSVAEAFQLHTVLFTSAGNPGEVLDPGKEHVAAVGAGYVPSLWQLARHSSLEAARIRRVTNLPNEHYVMLFRQLFIGSSSTECAIITPVDHGIDRMARVLTLGDGFWLERLVEQMECPIEVDGHELEPGELIPLRPGQRWSFAQSTCVIEAPEQDLSGY
jgi:hypothetical protein